MRFTRAFRFSIAAVLILAMASCRGDSRPDTAGESVGEPAGQAPSAWEDTAFETALDAHGGLEPWRSYGTLEFDLESGGSVERHLVDLRERTVLVTAEDWRLGYDGRNAWVEPGLDAYSGNPMFYSSLHFYFFSLPFVLADPGTVHRPLGMQTIDGKAYDVHQVGFETGVGDSPEDVYRMYLDPETGRLDVLLYTATFHSGEPSDRFGARIYTWQEVDGLLVPASYTPHAWNAADSTLGDARGTVTFRNVRFDTERPDSTLFTAPAGSERFVPES